jgi:hypothetical protein
MTHRHAITVTGERMGRNTPCPPRSVVTSQPSAGVSAEIGKNSRKIHAKFTQNSR